MTAPEPTSELESDGVPAAEPDTSIRAALSPRLVRLLVGVGFSSLGGGLTLALFVVYLS